MQALNLWSPSLRFLNNTEVRGLLQLSKLLYFVGTLETAFSVIVRIKLLVNMDAFASPSLLESLLSSHVL